MAQLRLVEAAWHDMEGHSSVWERAAELVKLAEELEGARGRGAT